MILLLIPDQGRFILAPLLILSLHLESWHLRTPQVLCLPNSRALAAGAAIGFLGSSGCKAPFIHSLGMLLNFIYSMSKAYLPSIASYDAACHLAEELPHASRNVPLALIGGVVINGLIGLVYCIVLLYSTSYLNHYCRLQRGIPSCKFILMPLNRGSVRQSCLSY